MEKKKKWYSIFFRDTLVEAPGRLKLKAPSIVIIIIMVLGGFIGVLMFSSWSCGGCSKVPMKTKINI